MFCQQYIWCSHEKADERSSIVWEAHCPAPHLPPPLRSFAQIQPQVLHIVGYPYSTTVLVAHIRKMVNYLYRKLKTHLVLFQGIFHIQLLSEVGNINNRIQWRQVCMYWIQILHNAHSGKFGGLFQHESWKQKYAGTFWQIMMVIINLWCKEQVDIQIQDAKD